MIRTKVVDEIKTDILCAKTFFFFRKSCFSEIMWINIS